ncbi:Uncharacterized protein Rs2_05333 [Raphanus sativus]|nr:Uncharacterized protein Rs2_05333 [Raphanus sativus]
MRIRHFEISSLDLICFVRENTLDLAAFARSRRLPSSSLDRVVVARSRRSRLISSQSLDLVAFVAVARSRRHRLTSSPSLVAVREKTICSRRRIFLQSREEDNG